MEKKYTFRPRQEGKLMRIIAERERSGAFDASEKLGENLRTEFTLPTRVAKRLMRDYGRNWVIIAMAGELRKKRRAEKKESTA